MIVRSVCYRLQIVLLVLGSILPLAAQEPVNTFPWTVLVPQNDSRDAEVQDQDDFDSQSLVESMNDNSDVFHHQLVMSKVSIKNLLSADTPFCELRFDAVRPLILTDDEKTILREYFLHGGFVVLRQDAYPYAQDEFWKVKSWPVIDFLTKELPALDSKFTVERITDAHPLFNQYYETQTADMVAHELQDNPYTPNRILLSYDGHPCAFVYGRYSIIVDGKWVAEPRPFERIFSLEDKGYMLTVNVYVYAMTH